MSERVWDQYLTERDKTHLAARKPKAARTVFGTRPAVISIDNYRSVAGDEPMDILEQVKSWPAAMGREAWDALDNIARLLRVVRDARIPIVHISGLSIEESGMARWSRWGTDGNVRAGDLTPEERDRHERRFDFMPQAAPVTGEVVFKKTAPSAFFGTPLIAALTAWNVDTLVIVGESTSGCVRATTVDAKSYRFNVVIVEECVYDRHQASHAMSLFDMNQKYATVLPLADTIRWIEENDDRSSSVRARNG